MAEPDQAAVCGAAIQAALLTAQIDLRDFLLLDVIPSSLGIESLGGVMTPLVKRDTSFPTLRVKLFTTQCNNQRGAFFQVYEGERAQTKDNTLLGRFVLSGIPPAPRGVPMIEVCLSSDADGLVTVSAKERTTGIMCQITLWDDERGLSGEEFERMALEAARYRDAACDVSSKELLALYTDNLRHSLASLNAAAESTVSWLGSSQSASDAEYEKRLEGLQAIARQAVDGLSISAKNAHKGFPVPSCEEYLWSWAVVACPECPE